MSERLPCFVCKRRMHRYGFDRDYYGADRCRSNGESHDPTAIACANGVIGLVERLRAEQDPDVADAIQHAVASAITDLGHTIDALLGRDPS